MEVLLLAAAVVVGVPLLMALIAWYSEHAAPETPRLQPHAGTVTAEPGADGDVAVRPLRSGGYPRYCQCVRRQVSGK
jgi:hypothetical protein